MTLLDRTTLAPPVPSVSGPAGSPGSPGSGGIPPAAGNSLRSGASAGGNGRGPDGPAAWRPPEPGLRAGRGDRPGSGVRAGRGDRPGSGVRAVRGDWPGSGVSPVGSRPGSGVPAAAPSAACGHADSAALRPARGAGVLIGLLRCRGPAGLLWLDGIGFLPGVGGIRPGWARSLHLTGLARTPVPG